MPNTFTRIAMVVTTAGIATALPAADVPTFSAEQVAVYEKEVRPILAAHCLKCHGQNPEKIRGGLDLTRRSGLIEGGDTGPAVDANKPDASLLLDALHYRDGLEMPPAGKLPDKDIATITKWVRDGLPWTPGEDTGKPKVEHAKAGPDKDYWAYQKVTRPSVPVVTDAAWVATPVDAFVRAKQEAAGVTPVGPASKAALCRRAYYDLTGLPPTPEQVDAFVADRSPDAYARLVDGLLDSPGYGEKWGRHWLDLVRYAETNGFERDGVKPHAWRYRDYVIKSFNADKPYDQFIKEQLAGDELNPEDPDFITATGYYRLGLWDDEPADAQQALFDGYDDLVTVTGQAMLGMTLNCCRCHDHKGDFFPQADYYRFLAFFRGIRPYSSDRSVISPNSQTDITPKNQREVYEASMAERQKRIEALEAEMRPIEDTVIKTLSPKDQLAVDDGHRGRIVRKVPDKLTGSAKADYLRLRDERNALRKRDVPGRVFAPVGEQQRGPAGGHARSDSRQPALAGGCRDPRIPWRAWVPGPGHPRPGRRGEDQWPTDRPGELGRIAGQPADRPGDGQSALALPLRHRIGPVAERFWQIRREADSPGPARLAGRRVRRADMEYGPGRAVVAQADAPPIDAIPDLSIVFGEHRGEPDRRPGQRSAVAERPSPADRRGSSRFDPDRDRVVEPGDVRAERLPEPAGRGVGRAVPAGRGLANLPAGRGQPAERLRSRQAVAGGADPVHARPGRLGEHLSGPVHDNGADAGPGNAERRVHHRASHRVRRAVGQETARRPARPNRPRYPVDDGPHTHPDGGGTGHGVRRPDA